MVEVIPGSQQLPPIRLSQARVDLGPGHALGQVRAPQRHALPAAHPASRPHVMRHVIMEGREIGIRRAIAAIVVECGGLLRRRFTPASTGATRWLVSETLHTLKLSPLAGDCGVGRAVVTTSAASYSTPISRIAVQF